MTEPNTLFLRLEGALQAWGDTSKMVIRRTMEAPTKSGVLGLLCCALGISRDRARQELARLRMIRMGVRTDRPGIRWWDYHTVGAGTGMTTAGGGLKTGPQGTLITRREYLADASFLVALQAEDRALVDDLAHALQQPKWPVFLGRRCCPPARPVYAGVDEFPDLEAALQSPPWCPRFAEDVPRDEDNAPCRTIALDCLLEYSPQAGQAAPPDAEVWYDTPVFFNPPVHEPRLVLRKRITVAVGQALQRRLPAPPRPRADYQNTEYKKRREARLVADQGLCVFCKNPATTVQHVTYRQAGGNETPDDLRSLCRLCHDAVTMIEYGLGMGLDRIDPCEARWRDAILRTRGEIIAFRSEEGRRRALRSAPTQVRRDLLEEEAS